MKISAFTSILLLCSSSVLLAADQGSDKPPKEAKTKTMELVNCTVADAVLSKNTTNRKYTKKGKSILLRVFPGENDTKTDELTIEYIEQERETKFREDLVTLNKIIERIIKLDDGSDKNCVVFLPEYERGTLVITLNKKEEVVGEFKVITGPEEHLYLSADLPVSSIKEISFDPTTNSFTEANKPSTFYLGVNYKLGDVYGKSNNPLHNLTAKAMVRVSSRPLESGGIGIGYKHKTVEFFVGSLWTKGESGSKTSRSTVVGISFDLSKGLSWVAPAKK